MSAEHVRELVNGCHVLADALDVATVYIVAQKMEAVAVLIGMAEAFVADQTAAVATLGLAQAAVPRRLATGRGSRPARHRPVLRPPGRACVASRRCLPTNPAPDQTLRNAADPAASPATQRRDDPLGNWRRHQGRL